MSSAKQIRAFLCSYDGDDGGGVVTYRFDPGSGGLHQLCRTPSEHPYYGAHHPDQAMFYTTNWVDGGAVSAYRIDADSGGLVLSNRQSSHGDHPCYVSVDSDGDYAFVANYTGGSVAILPIRPDGRLGPATDTVYHEGSSVDPDRQASPHPHAIVPGPRNRYVYVPDLGTDRVVIYRFNRESGRFEPANPPSVELEDGAGPRHISFRPDGRFAYVINELNSTITALARNSEAGRLDPIQTVDTLPDAYDGHNQCADVQVHPSGQWVYGSNRGHDSIAWFAIDGDSGRLRPAGRESTGGHFPQDLALAPTGGTLFAGNRRSDELIAFDINDSDGRVTPTGVQWSVPEPSHLLFLDFS